MHFFTTVVFVAVICCTFLTLTEQQYVANWTSIDSRPLPAWYDESKVGIFIHWGVFSVPSIDSEWYVIIKAIPSNLFQNFSLHRMWWRWKGDDPFPKVVAFMNRTYPSDWTYADFAAQFRAEFYGNYRSLFTYVVSKTHFFSDPNEWADIFAASGAKYVRFIHV
jgi:alpha-L-fucosidase